MSFTIPVTQYDAFVNEVWPTLQHTSLRFGQAFHQYMKLEKITTEKEWCDRLYNTDKETATKMIESKLDYNC